MGSAEGSDLNRAAAGRVHFATDPRIRRLAETKWRTQTGGTYPQWLALGKDHPETLIDEAREWVRAAVAGGVMRPPEPGTPALAVADDQCSFCGKAPNQHVRIVAGAGVAICAECVELVTILLAERAEVPQRRPAIGHEDECDKVIYEGGTCTCDLIRESSRATAGRREEAAEAVGVAAMEGYDGPAMDY